MSDQLRELLRILERDGTVTVPQLAVMLGTPEATVEALLDEARRDGVLVKVKGVVNWTRAGDTSVTAIIEVKVMPQRGVGFDAVAERIYRYPEVRTCYLVSGDYDLAAVVTAPTMHEVAAFVSEKLATLEHVASTATHFLLKRYKDDGEIYEEPHALERLAVSP